MIISLHNTMKLAIRRHQRHRKHYRKPEVQDRVVKDPSGNRQHRVWHKPANKEMASTFQADITSPSTEWVSVKYLLATMSSASRVTATSHQTQKLAICKCPDVFRW
jgi:hypothetical protein